MADASAPLLDDASIALVESAHAAKVLAVVAADGRATLVHAHACRFDRARQQVLATVGRSQALPVLDALRATRRVAFVACHIDTFRSLQLKGDDAELVEPTLADCASAAAHGVEFAAFGASLGHDAAVMRAHMQCRADDVVAVAFTVRQAFVQTPGPGAGQPLPSPPC
jgi:hypothetical protein